MTVRVAIGPTSDTLVCPFPCSACVLQFMDGVQPGADMMLLHFSQFMTYIMKCPSFGKR